jgi:ABC-2 type transport system ATP-binding protein
VLDIMQPTAGRIEVLGHPPGAGSRRDVGFLPEERGLYRRMTARESVIYFARLKGMTAPAARAAADRLLERVGLAEVATRRIEAMSKGMAQKVQLAAALVNAPRLILLDLSRHGSTVVFSTHVMQHAERLCDRLVLIAEGRKLFDGTQHEARRLLPGRLDIKAQNDPSGLPGVRAAEWVGFADGWTDWRLTLDPGFDPDDLLEACFAGGMMLRHFDAHRPSLHDVFVELVQRDVAARAA